MVLQPVGIIANPVASRDIRMVGAHAGNVSVSDRANIIFRIRVELAGCGVNQVRRIPEYGDYKVRCEREVVRARNLPSGKQSVFRQLNMIDMPVTRTKADVHYAARYVCVGGAGLIIIPGEDWAPIVLSLLNSNLLP